MASDSPPDAVLAALAEIDGSLTGACALLGGATEFLRTAAVCKEDWALLQLREIAGLVETAAAGGGELLVDSAACAHYKAILEKARLAVFAADLIEDGRAEEPAAVPEGPTPGDEAVRARCVSEKTGLVDLLVSRFRARPGA